MRIGELSKRAATSAHTIRYYEKQGLLPRPMVDASGHRQYSPSDVELLNWVICLKHSGMSLSDIKAYSGAHQRGDKALMTTMLERHVGKLQQQQRDIAHYLEVTSRKLHRLKGLT